MTSRLVWAALGAPALLGLMVASPGLAQTSLFSQPLATEAAPAPEAAPAAPRVRKPKPKPRGPVPARSLTVSNASANALLSLEVSGDGKTAKLANPVAPDGKAVLKLPAMKQCVVSVAATFEGAGQAEASDLDICKEKTIRFTE